jgi:hypothetical protein
MIDDVQSYQSRVDSLRVSLGEDATMTEDQKVQLQGLVDVMDGALEDVTAGRKTVNDVRIAFRTYGLDHETIMQHLFKYLHGDTKMCGCFEPEAADALIVDICDLVAQDSEWEVIRDRIGDMIDDGAVHIVMSVIDGMGLISHGSSIRSPWITDRGEWVRQAYRQITDEILEYGFPHGAKECPPECPLGQLSQEGQDAVVSP